MKKIAMIILVSLAASSLVGCGNSDEEKRIEQQKAASQEARRGEIGQPSPERKW